MTTEVMIVNLGPKEIRLFETDGVAESDMVIPAGAHRRVYVWNTKTLAVREVPEQPKETK